MNKLFYQKLALNNIQKNSKTYIPYILTCIGTIMMFYNMCFLVVAKDIGSVSDSGSVRYLLFLGAIVIGIFSLIFLFYTNSFLIKRRKKEFGLFNILGMEKKHVAKIMFHETIITAAISLISGLILGILISKLMILLLLKLISFKATFGFEVPIISVLISIALFCMIFFINLIYNIRQVHISNPIELLKGGNTGEKEPKTKKLMTIIGALSLGAGYYIAVVTKSPLEALNLFFVAVILVIIGTYCLFTAGSIAILKMLKKNKNYYYKPKNFISVSSMIYRMKQNAAGLANICILSTCVIVMISSTISLYIGMEDALRTRFPRNVMVNASNVSDEQAEALDRLIEKNTSEYHVEVKNPVRFRVMSLVAMEKDSKFITNNYDYSSNNSAVLIFMTKDEYNRIEHKDVSLNNNESLIYSLSGNISGKILNINGLELLIKERLTTFDSAEILSDMLTDSYIVVVDSKNTIDKVFETHVINKEDEDADELSYIYGFDADTDEQTQMNLVYSLSEGIGKLNVIGYVQGAEASRDSFYTMYGGLFFLGIFLGILFIMATVLIIYYKQIVEGYDDKERFEIMQKVGMSRDEVKRAIKSQVLMVFFLPLITAIIHIAFAFNVITRLLAIFNLTNVPLFALCTVSTIVVFAIIYTLLYILTARTYYKIVS
ncbi:MAG: ABC transporter permease [Tissierellia bacterium]|nr:ABC transporter permease [Tissierellia bacterium]